MEIYAIFNRAADYGLPVGIALVVHDGVLKGTVTEGDIRKAIIKHGNLTARARDVMQPDPILFNVDESISDVMDRLPHELAKRNRRSKKYLSKIVFVDGDGRPARVIEYHQIWEQKVASHRHVVVVGLGYVGLTLAATLAEAGFKITGVDVDARRIEMLSRGESYIHEVGLDELVREQAGRNLEVSMEMPDYGDVFVISVGTPIEKKTRKPVLKYIHEACESVARAMKPGALVVLRSTIPIGTSRNVVKPVLEQISGLKCGLDFHLSFAPERTAEGRALKELRTLPQLIGGYDNDSLAATAAVFRDLTKTIIRLDSLEAAEMAKLINNTFRDYVFAYANQMSRIAARFNLDVEQVIRASNEGYIRDPVPLPSPGVGGPCLTKDPYIFASLSEAHGFDPVIFLHSRELNESMHGHVVSQLEAALDRAGKDIKNVSILICGLAFKGEPETGDIRDSSSLAVAKMLQKRTGKLFVHDAIAQKAEIEAQSLEFRTLPAAFEGIDVVMFLNNHKTYEKLDVFGMVRAMAEHPVVFDGWRLFHMDDILETRPSVYASLSLIRDTLGEIE